jgi:hypothetical protein
MKNWDFRKSQFGSELFIYVWNYIYNDNALWSNNSDKLCCVINCKSLVLQLIYTFYQQNIIIFWTFFRMNGSILKVFKILMINSLKLLLPFNIFLGRFYSPNFPFFSLID